MKKNIFKVLEFVFFFTAFFFMFGASVNAYLDPSVVTYTIQVGAGIIIAVAAAVGIYYRKAKKKISKKLGIDENRNKEVESDEVVEEESEPNVIENKKTEEKSKETKSKTKEKKETNNDKKKLEKGKKTNNKSRAKKQTTKTKTK